MKKIISFATVFIIFFPAHKSIALENYSYGFNFGINYNKIQYEEGYIYVVDKYSYPCGFTAGVYLEIPLSKRWAIINEINVQRSYMKMHIWTDIDMIDQEYNMSFLCVPILVKYDPKVCFLPFIIAGPGFKYPINARYNSKAVFSNYDSHHDLDISNELPSFSTSAVLGIGKEFDISNFSLFLQIRGQISITKYKLAFAPEWYTKSIHFLIGFTYYKE